MITEQKGAWAQALLSGKVDELERINKENVAQRMSDLLMVVADICGSYPAECADIDPRAWEHVSVYGREPLEKIIGSMLTKRLHEARVHPDYEYRSIEWPYKYCGTSTSPEGNGWEVNVDLDQGLSRYTNTEDHHWLRLKSAALTDDVVLYEMPPLPYPKVTRAEYMSLLRDAFMVGYMPNSTSTKSHNHKPAYVGRVSDLLSCTHGSCVYALVVDDDLNIERALRHSVDVFGEGIFWNESFTRANSVFIYETDDFKVLTVLKDEKTFVTTKRKDGSFQKWQPWIEQLELPLNREHLKSILKTV